MRKLYIGFSKAKSNWAVLSKLIRWAQGTPFSHVYVRFDSESLHRTFIYQASGSKVNFENIALFNSHSIVVKEFELDVSEETYTRVLQFAIDNVGKPYSVKQLIGMAWGCLKQKLGFSVENPFKDRTDAFVCSEIGADVLEIAGKQVPEDKDSLGPKEVYKLLEEQSA